MCIRSTIKQSPTFRGRYFELNPIIVFPFFCLHFSAFRLGVAAHPFALCFLRFFCSHKTKRQENAASLCFVILRCESSVGVPSNSMSPTSPRPSPSPRTGMERVRDGRLETTSRPQPRSERPGAQCSTACREPFWRDGAYSQRGGPKHQTVRELPNSPRLMIAASPRWVFRGLSDLNSPGLRLRRAGSSVVNQYLSLG